MLVTREDRNLIEPPFLLSPKEDGSAQEACSACDENSFQLRLFYWGGAGLVVGENLSHPTSRTGGTFYAQGKEPGRPLMGGTLIRRPGSQLPLPSRAIA